MPFKPALKSLAPGQVLCREGDPPGPLYVICSGAVRAYRRSLTTPDSIQELALLGPGDIVGELAALLRQPRSATVQAVQRTDLLEVSTDQLGHLSRRHDGLMRVIVLALKDRAGLSAAEIATMASQVGLHVSADVFAGEVDPNDESALPVPPHDPAVVYPKSLTCPTCLTSFSTLVVHARRDQPAGRATDFHQRYVTPFNPYDYELWVCPKDLYAALPADFTELPEVHKARLEQTVKGVVAEWGGEAPDFNVDRTFELREKALELALAQYRMRQLSPLRLAAILHRLAWLARERGDPEAERTWLAQAMAAYSRAYETENLDGAKEELRVLYLCGELSARIGDMKTALGWFGEALRHAQLKDFPNWERMLRDRWSDIRHDTEGATDGSVAASS